MYTREIVGKYSQAEVNKIIELYESGLNQLEIANLFGTFNTSIRRILKRNGVNVLNQTERHRMITPDFFDNYENPDIQYWLGVIASDGCMTNRNLIIETIDKEWMEDYRDFLNPNINITTTLPKRGRMLYRVATGVVGLAESLEKYGIIKQKSLLLEWKYPITRHFLRGVFDGDGSAFFSKQSRFVRMSIVSGSEVFILQLQNFLFENNIEVRISKHIKNRKNPLYSLEVTKYEDKIKFHNLLYEDAKYFLKRKKEKMDTILSVVKNTESDKKPMRIFNESCEHIFKSMSDTAKFLQVDQRKLSSFMKNNKQISKIYTCEFV